MIAVPWQGRIPGDHLCGALLAHGCGLGLRGDARHPRAHPRGQLHRREADIARGPGDQHLLPPGDARAVQEPHRGAETTGDGGDLDIRERRVGHIVKVVGAHQAVFREGPVDLGAEGHEPHRVFVRRAGDVDRAGDPRAECRGGDAIPLRHHLAAQIAALYERKAQRAGPAARRNALTGLARGPGHLRRIPALARVDIGVVDPRRQHAQQHLARAGARHRDIHPPLKRLRPAVAGEIHAAHGGGQGHARSLVFSGSQSGASGCTTARWRVP